MSADNADGTTALQRHPSIIGTPKAEEESIAADAAAEFV